MRDPNRINGFIKKFTELWKLVPDWRFGQLVSNLQKIVSENYDPFYTEDDIMFKAIEYYIAELKERKDD